MQKKALLALLLMLTMVLSGCSLIVKDEAVDAARVVIRVGDKTYTKAEVQAQVDSTVQQYQYLYAMYGMTFDTTDTEMMDSITDSVIDGLIENAVLLAKAKELGLDQSLTDEDKAQIDADVADEMDYLRQSAASSFGLDLEADADEINKKLEEMGYTEEMVYQNVYDYALMDKAEEYAVKDVTVSEEEITAEFNTQVENAKASYADNLSAYGQAVLNGSTVYYRPAGYRNVKQILIQFAEEDSALVSEIQTALNNVITEQNNLANMMYSLGATNMDDLANQVTVELVPATETPTATVEVASSTPAFTEELDETVSATAISLAEAKAKRAFLETQLVKAQEQAYANIDAEADEVLAALAAGEDWDALAAAHNDDPGMQAGAANAETGYPVCEGFTQFDETFVSGAMAIANVGEHSDKIAGSYGYYIIQYTSDVTEGAVELDTVHDSISATLLTNKQSTVRDEVVAQWVKDANATINKKPLED